MANNTCVRLMRRGARQLLPHAAALTLVVLIAATVSGCISVSWLRSYSGDGGGITTNPLPTGWVLTFDPADDVALRQKLEQAYPVVENALPTAVEVPAFSPSPFDDMAVFTWAPGGRPTKMPAVSHGPGVLQVDLLIGRYLERGDPVAQIRFGEDIAVPNVQPTPFMAEPYYYRLSAQAFDDVVGMLMARASTN